MKKNESAEINSEKQHDAPKAKKIVILLLSLVAALFLWIYAIGYDSTLFDRTFNGIEVVIEGENELFERQSFILADGQDFSSVSVVAKGKRSELNELDSSDFRAVVDVSQLTTPGVHVLDIKIISPNGIEATPSSTTVSVYVDEFTQRNELIEVEVETGNYVMTEGVTFVNAVANPLTVLVSGPASVLDSIDKAYVKFDLDGHQISDDMYGYGAIELRDKGGNIIDDPYVSLSETTAYVTISVTKQKVVPVKVVFTGGIFSAEDATVVTSLQTVTVSGSPDALKSIDELVISIDESTIDSKAELEFALSALLPAGVANESDSSKITVSITLPKQALRVYTVPADAITVINLPAGMTFKVINAIDVNLIGPRDAFDSIDRGLLTATVDFDRVTVNPDGSYTALAEISLGGDYPGIYVMNIPYEVSFTIE